MLSPDFVKSNPRAVAKAILPLLHDTKEGIVLEAIASFARVCTEDEYFNNIGGQIPPKDGGHVHKAGSYRELEEGIQSTKTT